MAEGKRVIAIAIDGSEHSEQALQCKLQVEILHCLAYIDLVY